MTDEAEIWKPVVGHEGSYEVSNMGRVRSLDRIETYVRRDQYSGRDLTITRRKKGRILRPGPNASGHLSVSLGRETGSRLVHALVMEAFGPPRPPGTEVCHNNGTPSDNRASNLRWGTRAENIRDAFNHGARGVGELHQNAKVTDAQALEILRKQKSESFAYFSRRFGISEATVRAIYYRKTWRHLNGGANAASN